MLWPFWFPPLSPQRAAPVERRLWDGARLATAIQAIAMSRTEEALILAVCAGARDIVRAHGASFITSDDAEVCYQEEDAIAPLWKGRRFPTADCLSGRAIVEGRTVAIRDIYTDETVPLVFYRPTFVRALALVPLSGFARGCALGVYWAAPHQLSEHEMVLLQAVGNSAAVGLANVRLHVEASEARAEAERANLLKDQAIGQIAHELRNPTQVVIGWAHRLQEAGVEPDRFARAIDAIARCAEQQQRLIEDLLDVSRLAGGTMKLDCRPLDVAELVAAAVEGVGPECERRGLALTSTCVDGAVHIVGDALRLRQVIDNLLSNALKFTPPHGSIAVSLRRVDDLVEIAVTDTGLGISAATMPHIFDRFYQVTSNGHRVEGLGLGLAIVKSLVELHGGRIDISSAGLERGTVARITLPMAA